MSFARGESVCPEFQIVMNNGMPFVMPPLNDNLGILVFTVKSGVSDDAVLTKYLNLMTAPIYSGYIDMSEGGYCKFLSQEPLKLNSINDVYNAYGYSPDSAGENTIDTPTGAQLINRKYIAYCEDTGYYYCWAQTSELSGRVVLYTFEFQLPIFPEDTQALDTKEYLYDICAYLGKYTGNNDGFPLSEVDWKMQLLRPHKLILEDSNNV